MPFPRYKTKDEIPAGAEDVYEEQGGEWVPRVEDVTPLKDTLAKVRSEKSAAERAAKEAAEKLAAAERERDTYKAQVGDPDARVAGLLKKYDADVAAAKADAEARAKELEGRVRDLTLGRQAEEAFLSSGGRPEKVATARRLFMDRLDMSEDRPVVKDAEGKVTTKTLAEFMADEFKKAEPELFSGTKAGGGGAGGFNGGTAGTGGLTFEQMMANPSLGLAAANEAGTT